MKTRRIVVALASAATLLAAGACGSSPKPGEVASVASSASGATLTVYSGRSESLVKPVIEKLEAATGVDVQVRYGGSSELAAQLLEEGDATKADLFFSQDAGALGALGKAGRLEVLDAAVTGKVLPGFSDSQGLWVATSARARVVAYNPDLAPEATSMTSIDAILDPKYKGKVGFAPTNASFHSFVTALRVVKGEDGAKDWLTKFKANEPRAYDKNGAVLDGVDKAEVAFGLINHYYWYEKVAEAGVDKVKAKIHFLNADDPGALINVAGVGIVKGTDAKDAAVKAIDYLLSSEGQTYFADETFEYPVIAGVTTKADLPALSELKGSSVDLNRLDSLDATLKLLEVVGLT